MLKVPSVVLEIFQTYWKKLADYDEADKVFYIADVELTNEALHFSI